MARFFETFAEWSDPVSGGALSVELAGVTHPDPRYRIDRRHGSAIYVLEYVVSGTGHLSVEGETHLLRAGDVYFLQPPTEHCYFADRRDPWTKLWFNLRGPLVDALCDAYQLRGRYVFPGCGGMRGLFEEGLRIVRAGGPGRELEFALQLHRILAGLSAAQRTGGPSEAGRRMREYLNDHCREPVALADLAKFSGRSPAQILRIFRRDFQTTPNAYLGELRLRRAKQYLEHTGEAVRAIASLCGFADPFYFSNWFRKATGLAPTQWRKRARG